MSFWTNASSAEITIVMPPITTMRLMLTSGIENASQNTG